MGTERNSPNNGQIEIRVNTATSSQVRMADKQSRQENYHILVNDSNERPSGHNFIDLNETTSPLTGSFRRRVSRGEHNKIRKNNVSGGYTLHTDSASKVPVGDKKPAMESFATMC
jgi:hypothetical protein